MMRDFYELNGGEIERVKFPTSNVLTVINLDIYNHSSKESALL